MYYFLQKSITSLAMFSDTPLPCLCVQFIGIHSDRGEMKQSRKNIICAFVTRITRWKQYRKMNWNHGCYVVLLNRICFERDQTKQKAKETTKQYELRNICYYERLLLQKFLVRSPWIVCKSFRFQLKLNQNIRGAEAPKSSLIHFGMGFKTFAQIFWGSDK